MLSAYIQKQSFKCLSKTSFLKSLKNKTNKQNPNKQQSNNKEVNGNE